MTTTVLDKIKAYKLEEIAADKSVKPLEEIEAEARAAEPVRPLCRGAVRFSPRGLWADRRDQESQPVQGSDPRRFRSRRAGTGI